jgi:hypothetical protein
MYYKLNGVGIEVSISCPFQINYLSYLYLKMDTFSSDMGDALLLDCLFSLHILKFSSQNLDVKVFLEIYVAYIRSIQFPIEDEHN